MGYQGQQTGRRTRTDRAGAGALRWSMAADPGNDPGGDPDGETIRARTREESKRERGRPKRIRAGPLGRKSGPGQGRGSGHGTRVQDADEGLYAHGIVPGRIYKTMGRVRYDGGGREQAWRRVWPGASRAGWRRGAGGSWGAEARGSAGADGGCPEGEDWVLPGTGGAHGCRAPRDFSRYQNFLTWAAGTGF